MDILLRAQAKVVKISEQGPSHNVVEIEAGEFQEVLVEIIRLRSVLEEIGESDLLSINRMRMIAREGILPDE